MKAFKVFLVVSALFLMTGVNQASAQQIIHLQDIEWYGEFWILTPENELLVIYGTIYQDLVIHIDKEGNWTKTNAQYDKSEFNSSTGEVFTLYGASLSSWPTPDCFNEVIQFRGNWGTMITGRMHFRYHDGKIIREVVSTHYR